MPARRDTVGPFASAALPSLWKGIARLNWSHSDFARAIEQSTAQASRLLYGDRRAGRRAANTCLQLFGTQIVLWDKPCPPNWKPHSYASLRTSAKAAAKRAGDDDELAATGTDG